MNIIVSLAFGQTLNGLSITSKYIIPVSLRIEIHLNVFANVVHEYEFYQVSQ